MQVVHGLRIIANSPRKALARLIHGMRDPVTVAQYGLVLFSATLSAFVLWMIANVGT
ncbi:MAG: hypothetical protein JOY91_11555 [Sinobacteraceae bacterium]|nr:hypothetical protein [Nevskiaceae bacterium]